MCDVDLITLQATLALIADTQRAAGITETSLLNFVVTDGLTMIATRCVFPETEAAASLYYAEGTAFQRSPQAEQSPLPPRASLDSKASLDSRASARDTSITGKLCSSGHSPQKSAEDVIQECPSDVIRFPRSSFDASPQSSCENIEEAAVSNQVHSHGQPCVCRRRERVLH